MEQETNDFDDLKGNQLDADPSIFDEPAFDKQSAPKPLPNSYSKASRGKVVEVVDTKTGELVRRLAEDNIVYRKNDLFIQVLESSIKALVKLNAPTDFKLILWITFNADLKGKINLVGDNKRLALDILGISDITFKKSIKSLLEVKLLIKIKRGIYLVNPEYIWKGHFTDRKPFIDTINTAINYKADLETTINKFTTLSKTIKANEYFKQK